MSSPEKLGGKPTVEELLQLNKDESKIRERLESINDVDLELLYADLANFASQLKYQEVEVDGEPTSSDPDGLLLDIDVINKIIEERIPESRRRVILDIEREGAEKFYDIEEN